MTRTLAVALILALAACGDSEPPPEPAAQPATPPQQAPAPQATAPETKAPEAPKPDPNKELALRVKRALEGDGKILAEQIDVTAKDGRVSLWGTAPTDGERSRAAQVAARVQGVTSVDNQLKVVKGS